MKRLLPFLLLGAAPLAAASAPAGSEDEDLRQALAEAGSSPVEFIRAIENHLARHPESGRKKELERSLVKAAMEVKDDRRILLYGGRLLDSGEDDLQILERVTRTLLAKDDRDRAERALKYAQRWEAALRDYGKYPPKSRRSQAEWRDEMDRSMGRALVCQARAAGNLGRLDDAVALAERGYRTYPAAEAAREIGLLLAKAGREQEALPHLADAFSIPDSRNGDADRAKDRKRLGEIYRKLHGSEAGLGDLLLQAYDRTSGLLHERAARQSEIDPNAGLEDPMQFTLTALDGGRMPLNALRGSVLVLDFWATWCGPCRVQHPIYEKIKERYRDRKNIQFLSINTDEDQAAVGPFLKANGWRRTVYFDDGLGRVLRISSIPTTIVVNRQGEVAARIIGFAPDRFEEMLVERIEEALKQ